MIDLHSHSNASDGTLSPRNLVEYASKKGVSVLALTDHDTTAGLVEAKKAAKKQNKMHLGQLHLDSDTMGDFLFSHFSKWSKSSIRSMYFSYSREK